MTRLQNVLADVSQTYNIPLKELETKYILGNKRKKVPKEEYIEAVEYSYNGTLYLVDNNNIVYSNDIQKPYIIGEKLVDSSIKFYKRS